MAIHNIIYVDDSDTILSEDTITLEEVYRRRKSRRIRVAKRLYKRFPLFTAEFMQEEFPGTTADQVAEIVSKKTRKTKSYRKVKSGLARFGRYPLMQKALQDYKESGDVDKLKEAQRLRSNMTKDFQFKFRIGKEVKYFRLPAHASYSIAKQIAAIKCDSWEELDSKWHELTKYGLTG